MVSEKDIAQILDFLAEKLSGEELQTFERRLAAEPELAAELKVQQGMQRVLRAGRREELDARMRRIRERKRQAKGRIPAWSYAAAAAIALVVLGGLWWLNAGSSREDLYAQHYSLYTLGGPVRSPEAVTPFEKAWESYIEGDFEKAQDYFDQVQPGDSLYMQVQLYGALCDLERGNFGYAQLRLQGIAQQLENPLRYDARWYVGLIYLKREEWKAALDVFKALQADKPRYRQAAVAEILSVLTAGK